MLLRFDPGDDRVHTARTFRVWEGGGEYNVARNLAKCFRHRSAIVTALADNQIGRLAEDLIAQGGVDTSQIIWRETDGLSRSVRNGIYFMERGFGSRPPTGCSDRGNTAVSKLAPGDVDLEAIFDRHGTRWFHTGGIFSALSDTTAELAAEAMQAARKSGAVVSYDLNYRDSLWSSRGGRDAANDLNRRLLESADVVFGVENFSSGFAEYSSAQFEVAARGMTDRYPDLQIVATTLRDIHSASRHDLGGVCYSASERRVYEAPGAKNVDVLDRVGSGDAFAAGLIHGVLSAIGLDRSIKIAAVAGCLALTSPGDGLAANLSEIERAAEGAVSHPVR